MGGGNLTAVFCDTGWEHPDTYKHVNDVCLQMGVKLITLKSKYDFVSLAAHKKRFPSTNARFCTSELKMKPMIDYVLSLKESCIIIQGIRAGESTARASALIDKYGYKGEYFLYCILMDFKESFARVNYWKSKSRRFLPHCQPFRDLNNPHQIIPQWQKDMAHWADRKEIYMSCDFKDFSPRKGFLCKEYFKIL